MAKWHNVTTQPPPSDIRIMVRMNDGSSSFAVYHNGHFESLETIKILDNVTHWIESEQ